MARRRKKSKAAAAQAKAKEKDSMLVDKSLPALPPSEKAAAEAKTRETAVNPHTELSPRPRPQYPDELSRSSSRRAESPNDMGHRDGLTLPTTTYRNNRHSQASDMTGDGDGFFIPLALDPSPAPTPRPAQNTKNERNMKENAAAKDMLSPSARSARGQIPMSQSTPHIAFQEKGRTPSSEYSESSKDGSTRRPPPRPSAGSRTTSATASPALGSEEPKRHLANSMSNGNANDKTQSQQDKFKLQDVPKRKRSNESRNSAKTDAVENPQARPLQKRENLSRTESAESTRVSQERPRGGVNQYLATENSADSRRREEPESRPSTDSAMSAPPARETTRSELPTASKPIPRKEVGGGKPVKTQQTSYGSDAMSSSVSSTDSTAMTAPTVNGKSISSPVIKPSEEAAPRLPVRPAPPQQKPSDTYMAPRAPPIPPPPSEPKSGKQAINPLTGEPISPKLPRWSGGGDFTMDEDMARILGTDERAESLLRRVSNAVRHGRTPSDHSAHRHGGHGRSISETTSRTATSGHWPKTPIAEDGVTSPMSISMGSPRAPDDSAVLRRQLRNSEQRVAELERVFVASGELKSVTKQLVEKRKTVHELGSQAEIMIRQIEVLAGYVERAKRAEGKQELDMEEMEESAIKDFVLRIERLKQSMSREVETLFEERETLLDEKAAAIKARDRALAEFEQMSSKNAQLADLNNDLTTQIQERFRAQSGPGAGVESPKPPMSSGSANGLGIYTHSKDKLSLPTLDDASSTTAAATAYAPSLATAHSFPHVLDADAALEPATVLSAPHVVNIRKAQAKKFNWKKGGATVAKGVSKGFKGAFGSERERNAAERGGEIGMPYNTTVTPVDSPSLMAPPQASQLGGGGGSLPKSQSSDPRGFGLFKKSHANSRSAGGASALNPAAENPATLFGSDLVERAAYERRHIPSVVIRCIEEVELRGMDVEGIYRKTGGSGLVRMIQEGFERDVHGTEGGVGMVDISDPDVDITAVTSVLKQYFRKLPVPLLTFEVYERVLEALSKFFSLVSILRCFVFLSTLLGLRCWGSIDLVQLRSWLLRPCGLPLIVDFGLDLGSPLCPLVESAVPPPPSSSSPFVFLILTFFHSRPRHRRPSPLHAPPPHLLPPPPHPPRRPRVPHLPPRPRRLQGGGEPDDAQERGGRVCADDYAGSQRGEGDERCGEKE